MSTTYDVAAFQKTSSGPYIQALITEGNNGRLISGAEKLSQRFILELMTPIGSIPYQPSRGTNFIPEAQSGQLNSEVDIFSSFALALLNISRNLSSEETDSDPDNERFSSAVLSSITVAPGFIILTLTITSLSGVLSNTTIPLAFNLNEGD